MKPRLRQACHSQPLIKLLQCFILAPLQVDIVAVSTASTTFTSSFTTFTTYFTTSTTTTTPTTSTTILQILLQFCYWCILPHTTASFHHALKKNYFFYYFFFYYLLKYSYYPNASVCHALNSKTSQIHTFTPVADPIMIDVIYVCDIIHHFDVTDPRPGDKVRQRGSGAESRARALRADPGV